MKSIQYTIRNIPAPVDRTLRERAKKHSKSFNQTVVEALKQATGTTEEPTEYHNLDWFIGSGGIGPKEEKAFKAQRVIDKEAWR